MAIFSRAPVEPAGPLEAQRRHSARVNSTATGESSSIDSTLTSTIEKLEHEKDGAVVDIDQTQTADVVVPASSDEENAQGPDNNNLPASPGERDPFDGGFEDCGINYKTLSWGRAGICMIAETISLGILTLPAAVAELGLILGLVILLTLGFHTSYTAIVIGQIKIMFPQIHSMAEACQLIFGKYFAVVVFTAQIGFIVFIMGAHILTYEMSMAVWAPAHICSVVFLFVAFVGSVLMTLPRTLKHMAWFSCISFASIFATVIIIMTYSGVEKNGFEHVDGNLLPQFRLWPSPDLTFKRGFKAVLNMVFAYAGHVAFFGFISELKNPKDFPKAVALLQITDTLLYCLIGGFVYAFGGDNVKSPAIGSLSLHAQKIAYAAAIPTIVIAGVINGHVAVKYLYVKLFRDSKDDILHQNSFKAIGYWVGLTVGLWLLAFILAGLVPVFADLVGITSALFASWFTFGLPGFFWLFMNVQIEKENAGKYSWKLWKWRVTKKDGVVWTRMKSFLLVLNIVNVLIGFFICIVGMYTSIDVFIAGMKANNRLPFSCAAPPS